ncbi:MAG: beta,4-mannosyltransferase [Actinomycetota bacterium]|jgi:glycosyltransferase involved in cell wall biosynthesis|nr:beta,4-mannosyltransferase [Actinomycetota bacterium]
MTMPSLLEVRTGTIRVLSVPTDHVYVHHLAPAAEEPPVQPEVLRLRDPQDPWWPPPALDPRWLVRRTADFDLLHLHFGFDARSVDDLRAVVDVLRSAGKPLVQTVHDLRNPHHLDRRTHDEHLDVLIPAADALVTLTPGAADEIRHRWGRTATVLPHPHVVPLAEMRRRRDLRASPESGFTVGLHLKSMRPCMSGPPVVDALAKAVAEIDGAVLRIDVHRDVAEPGGDRYDSYLMEAVWAAQERGAHVHVHDFYSDEELWDYLQSIDVSVLPYRYGTHSGWLEACRDLGTAVAAPDCGYYADQGPVHTFHLDEDGLDVASVRAAIGAARAAGRPVPLSPALRAAQRRAVAAAHAKMYRELLR